MEQWVLDGRFLTDDGKGICDCIIQFSNVDAAIAGKLEVGRSEYVRFNDLSKDEAIKYLTLHIKKEEVTGILDEIKTTRIGDLEKVIVGKKDSYLTERNIQVKIASDSTILPTLKKMLDGKPTDAYQLMKELGFKVDEKKKFFQHPLFTEKLLMADLEHMTVSFDSEYVKDYVRNQK